MDTIIRNGTIIDGSGAPGFRGDVAIEGGKISDIGALDAPEGVEIIDAAGRVVCPGIIDVHSHADLSVYRADHTDLLEPLVRQGITTFIGGNCGLSLAPIGDDHVDLHRHYIEAFVALDFEKDVQWKGMGEFLDTLDKRGTMLNCAILAPHGLLRIDALGFDARLARDDEVERMAAALERAMDEGAIGLSTGLQYFPGLGSDTRELVRLGAALKKYDGIFTSHMRSYTHTLANAFAEVVEVAEKNQIRAQVSHLHYIPYMGPLSPVLQRTGRALARLSKRFTVPLPLDLAPAREINKLDRLRERGTNVRVDAMPTTTGFTHMFAFFPPWVLQGSADDVALRLFDPAARAEMVRSIEQGPLRWPHRERDNWTLNLMKIIGWPGMRIMSVQTEKNKRFEGRTLISIAEEQKKSPIDAACDLLIEEAGKILVFFSYAEPEDSFTEQINTTSMKHPEVHISTDTILMGFGKPSYLFYSTYPKFLGRYVREKKWLSLETAVRKITGLAADHFALKNRGYVRKGYAADLLVFDPDTIAPGSTFEDPVGFPIGIDHVFVNGAHMVNRGAVDKSALSGEVIRNRA
jgi:N-acyl-D-aspartate/D-glutamate deacylase